jgi:hypothetical protein
VCCCHHYLPPVKAATDPPPPEDIFQSRPKQEQAHLSTEGERRRTTRYTCPALHQRFSSDGVTVAAPLGELYRSGAEPEESAAMTLAPNGLCPVGRRSLRMHETDYRTKMSSAAFEAIPTDPDDPIDGYYDRLIDRNQRIDHRCRSLTNAAIVGAEKMAPPLSGLEDKHGVPVQTRCDSRALALTEGARNQSRSWSASRGLQDRSSQRKASSRDRNS